MSAAEGSRYEQLSAWLEANADALLDDPKNNLVGVGIGKKSAGPLDDGSPYCVTGFVEKKLSTKQIDQHGIKPMAEAVAQIGGKEHPLDPDLEIDVVETGSRFLPHPGPTVPAAHRGLRGGRPPTLDLQKRFNLLRSGIGIANPHRHYPTSHSVGTLGFFVRDVQGRNYLVSNNHVIADENNGRVGEAIVQPGTLDLTKSELAAMSNTAMLTAQLTIALLSAWVDIRMHGPPGSRIPLNRVDCAAAELKRPGRSISEIERIGFGGSLKGIALPFTVDPETGAVVGSTRVYKAGRTTGWTEGTVSAIGVVTDVQYLAGRARFRDQIGITASSDNTGSFSKPGDSGSAIVNSDQQLVGLLFAGSVTVALANPIQYVLHELTTVLNVGPLTVVVA